MKERNEIFWFVGCLCLSDVLIALVLLVPALSHNPQERFVSLEGNVHWAEVMSLFLRTMIYFGPISLVPGVMIFFLYRIFRWVRSQSS